MSEAIKPTPGPCYADGQVVHSDAVTCIAKFGDAYSSRGWAGSDFATEAHKEANAELFTEALNVHHNTGLTPVQLVERVKELEEALRAIVDAADAPLAQGGEMWFAEAVAPPIDEARAAPSKALPNTKIGATND